MTTTLEEREAILDAAPRRVVGSIGTQYVNAPEFRAFRERGGHRSSGAWRAPVVEVIAPPDMRSAIVDSSGMTVAEVVPMRPVPQIVPTVASLCAQGRTTANAIQYPYDNAPPITGKAAITAAGVAKAALAAGSFQLWTQPVVKSAGYVNASDEQFEDVPGLQSYIDARLTRAVDLGVDADLCAQIAALPGLTPTAAAAGGNAASLLRQAMVILAASGYMPDGIVIHPNALYGTFVIAGQELQGADLVNDALTDRAALYLYGMRVVPSLAVAAPTTAIIGAFGTAAQVFWRDEMSIEASSDHVDNFIKNMITIRGERRYAPAFYSQAAFST